MSEMSPPPIKRERRNTLAQNTFLKPILPNSIPLRIVLPVLNNTVVILRITERKRKIAKETKTDKFSLCCNKQSVSDYCTVFFLKQVQ